MRLQEEALTLTGSGIFNNLLIVKLCGWGGIVHSTTSIQIFILLNLRRNSFRASNSLCLTILSLAEAPMEPTCNNAVNYTR